LTCLGEGRSTCQGALLTSAKCREESYNIDCRFSRNAGTGRKEKSEFFTKQVDPLELQVADVGPLRNQLVGSLMANEMDTPSFDKEMKRRIE
jgi:hypothetical protein